MLRSRRGSALVQVILVIVIFAILGTALIALSTTEYLQGEKANKATQAYYCAKSGVEIAIRLFEKDFNTYSGYGEFHFYGNLGSDVTIGDFAGHENSQITATVTNTPRPSDPSSHEVTIAANGTYEGVKEQVIYKFSYTAGGVIGEPAPPSTEPGGPGVDGGPADEGGIGWYDDGGVLDSHGGESTKPVVFNAGNGEYIFKKNDTDPPFYAPQMYFTDVPVSLVVRENMNLDLYMDFISFKGDVDGEKANNDSHYGLLTLHVNASKIDGEDIGGTAGVKYGVVYIGTNVRNTDDILLGAAEEERGYYYFPNGINLTGSYDIDRLIKIDNINSVDFEKLGTTITTNGGISSGIYQ